MPQKQLIPLSKERWADVAKSVVENPILLIGRAQSKLEGK